MSNVLYPIPAFSQPNVSYCQMFNSFDNGRVIEKEGEPPVYHPERDELKRIKDLGESLIFAAGSVGSGVVIESTRKSTVAWVDDNPNTPALEHRRWLISKLQGAIGMANADKFQLDLDGFAPAQYTKYNLNEHYNWHCDVSEGERGPLHRKLSLVLMVSGPDEYEGGELELNLSGNPENTMLLKPDAGTSVLFYSHLPHRVRPVTSGNRISVVIWGLGPRIR